METTMEINHAALEAAVASMLLRSDWFFPLSRGSMCSICSTSSLIRRSALSSRLVFAIVLEW